MYFVVTHGARVRVETGNAKPASTRPSSGLVQMSGNAWKLRDKGFRARLNAPVLRTWRQVCHSYS